MTDDCLPLPALTLGQIAELVPVHYVTLCRWRDTDGMPSPDFVPAGNQKRALWSVQTVRVWMGERGWVLDETVLARIVSNV